MRARELMTTTLVTVSPSTHVKEAVELLVTNGFTVLPVVDNGQLVGVVTEADVLRDRIAVDPRALVHPDWPVTPGDVPALIVGAVMTTNVVVTPSGADAAELVRVMLDRHLRAIPIVDAGQLVGIVTRRDLLRTVARDDETIVQDVRDRLSACFQRGDWAATVSEGVVTLVDEFDDGQERHVATVLAGAVAGVVEVRVVEAPVRA